MVREWETLPRPPTNVRLVISQAPLRWILDESKTAIGVPAGYPPYFQEELEMVRSRDPWTKLLVGNSTSRGYNCIMLEEVNHLKSIQLP